MIVNTQPHQFVGNQQIAIEKSKEALIWHCTESFVCS